MENEKKLIEKFEIYNQGQQLYAEGIAENQPKQYDVLMCLLNIKFAASNIKIWFDNIEKIWRWYADIDNIN